MDKEFQKVANQATIGQEGIYMTFKRSTAKGKPSSAARTINVIVVPASAAAAVAVVATASRSLGSGWPVAQFV